MANGTIAFDTLQTSDAVNTGTTKSIDTSYIFNGVAKAWFQASSDTTLSDSFNISSGTDNGTGDYSYALSNAFVNDDYSRLANYHVWTMFPFGRMARDAKGVIENPAMTIEKTTGIPYLKLSEEFKSRRVGTIDALGKRETKKLAKDYPWMQRAIDNPLRTSKNESVRTAVEKHPDHGWIVFPTIRLDGEELKQYSLKEAMNIALKNKDFIKVDSLQEGNRISQGFSKRLTLNEKGE